MQPIRRILVAGGRARHDSANRPTTGRHWVSLSTNNATPRG
jgi:hypothetical protein